MDSEAEPRLEPPPVAQEESECSQYILLFPDGKPSLNTYVDWKRKEVHQCYGDMPVSILVHDLDGQIVPLSTALEGYKRYQERQAKLTSK